MPRSIRMLGRGRNTAVLGALLVAIAALLTPGSALAAPSCPPTATLDDVHSGASVSGSIVCDDPSGTGLNWSTHAGHDAQHGFVQYDQAGTVFYTSDPDYAGPDSFQIQVDDNEGGSVLISVSVSVVNAAPDCNNNTFFPRAVPRDTTTQLPLAAQCSDPDGDAIEFTRIGMPAHGTVTAGPAASLSYTPQAGYTGPDSFTYVAKDSAGGTSTVTTYAMSVVDNVLPTCTPAPTVSLRPGQSRQVTMSCSDPNLGAITYKIVSGPAKGTLSPSGNSTSAFRQYTAGSSAGADSYTYRASSASGDGPIYTQSISIDPSANQIPSCFSNSLSPEAVHAGRSRSLHLASACSDPDDDALSFTPELPNPQHGTTVVSGGQIIYTPAGGYSGSDTVHYIASDGHGGIVHGTYSVTVDTGSANATPHCDAASITTPNATKVTVHLVCTDGDGDYVTLSTVSAPDVAKASLGAIDQASRTVDFTPAAGYSGSATFTFKGSDGATDAAPATVTVTIDPPTGRDSGGGGAPAPAATGDPGVAPPAGPGVPGPAAADRTPPRIALGPLPKLKLAQLLKKGLQLKFTLSEDGKIAARLVLPRTMAKRLKLAAADMIVGSATRSARAGAVTIVVKLKPAVRRKLTKLRSVALAVAIVATDGAGNEAAVKKPLTIHR